MGSKWSVVTDSTFDSVVEELQSVDLLVSDIETYKTEGWAPKFLGVAFGYQVGRTFKSYYFPFGHEVLPHFESLGVNLTRSPKELQPLLEKDLVFHNCLFDLQGLRNVGLEVNPEVSGRLWDTMVMAHLVDENRFTYALDSFGVAKDDLGPLEKLVEWHQIPIEVMGKYACQDLLATAALFNTKRLELESWAPDGLWPRYEAFLWCLLDTIGTGIQLDRPRTQRLLDEAHQELERLQAELGLNPSKRSKVLRRLHGSLVAVPGELALPDPLSFNLPVRWTTDKGDPAVDDLSLKHYTAEHPEIKPFVDILLEWRGLSKLAGTFYQGLLTKADVNGAVHPGLNPIGTVTGRLSCREPNLQQIPRGPKVKRLFGARPGYVLIQADFSQAELRLASFYAMKVANDPVLYEAYVEGIDVHTLTAERLAIEVPPQPGGKSIKPRDVGKQINFMLLYGGGHMKLKEILFKDAGIEVDAHTAKNWTDGFRETYPGLRKMIYKCQSLADKQGYVNIWNGRRKRYPHFLQGKTHDAWNAVVQGGVGAVTMEAMVAIHQAKLPGVYLCNQVHDAIWFQVAEDSYDELVPQLKTLMQELPEKYFEMPFPVDIDKWTELYK